MLDKLALAYKNAAIEHEAAVADEGAPHWYLVDLATGRAVDPTADQFRTSPDYSRGIGKGFLTSAPSKRARAILAAI